MNPHEVKKRLETAFPHSEVDVLDMTGTQDHYEVFVKSAHFKDLSRIEQHQLVMKAFDEELKSGEVHALSIRTQKGD
jgi:stress-induced morphogen